jgi:hypothetical protein
MRKLMQQVLKERSTWMTTMVPTTVATCAALGEGGSPSGVSLITMYCC